MDCVWSIAGMMSACMSPLSAVWQGVDGLIMFAMRAGERCFAMEA